MHKTFFRGIFRETLLIKFLSTYSDTVKDVSFVGRCVLQELRFSQAFQFGKEKKR
jgi:hypothetical protein